MSCVKKTHNMNILSVLEINKLVVIIKTRSHLSVDKEKSQNQNISYCYCYLGFTFSVF